MIQTVNSPVSVILAYNHERRQSTPLRVIWKGKTYSIEKVGYHHTYRQGRALVHVFSVSTKNMFLRLVLNSETLDWRVSEVADAEVN